MHIAALQKTTLLDYPGKLACTVFLRGCNLRCPFCHNGGLVLPEKQEPRELSRAELLAFLKKRRGLLDGVCITGGEPTLNQDLPELIQAIRELGFLIKLDTNGSNPQMLQDLLSQGLLNYVAMDIKNAPDRYLEICGGVDVIKKVKESVQILMHCSTAFEFRTTVCHPYHDEEAMEEIGAWLQGPENYYLQYFEDSGNLVGSGCTALTDREMTLLQETAKKYIPNTRIRGK